MFWNLEIIPTFASQKASTFTVIPEQLSNHPANDLLEFFQGCKYIYLDVGSNVGVQIRKLYEPERYPGAPVLEIFDEIFGKDRQNRTDICAVGFEPNPYHIERLKALENAYQTKGWRVKIFTETAVGTQDGEAEFFFDTLAAPEHHQWGASLIPWQGDMKNGQSTTVRTVDLAGFLLKYIAWPTGFTRNVVMKMDVEGAEHLLLPHMIITGALCHIDLVFTEYHEWGGVMSAGNMTARDFAAYFSEYVENYDQKSCKTRFRDLDDETYGSSDFPLPEFIRRILKWNQS